jgi:hypothetical protein
MEVSTKEVQPVVASNPEPAEHAAPALQENPFKFSMPLITWLEIRNNFMILSDFTHGVVRTESYTSHESGLKYNYYCSVKTSMYKWGTFATIPPVCLFIRYCIKGRHVGRKMLGFLGVTMTTSHFFVWGQCLAIYLNMKEGLDSFCIDTNYELGSQMENFLFLLRQRNELSEKGVELMTDQQFLTMIYDEVFNLHRADKAQAIKKKEPEVGNKYVANNYFAKNKDRFTKRNDNDESDPSRVFSPVEGMSTSSQPLLYFDNWFTRYIVNSQVRWWTNLGKYMSLIEDN